MIEAIAADLIAPPPAIVQEARSRSRSRGRGRSRSRGVKRAPAWPFIVGAVILLSDGRKCHVWQDENERWHCTTSDETRRIRRLEQ